MVWCFWRLGFGVRFVGGWCLMLVVRCSLFVVLVCFLGLLFVVCRLKFVVRCSVFVVCWLLIVC